MKRHVIGVAAAMLGTMLMGGVVATQTAAAAPVPTTVTLPLFGAPLTIGITTGPGGALATVTVDPATGNTATSASPHKVVFQSANPKDLTGDPARVVIKSKHGGQSVSARAGSLADFIGKPGGWSGDVFGDGTTSTVAFTIAAAADGGPDITGVTATGAANVIGAVERSTGEGDDDEGTEMSARVSIKFTNAAGDQSRTLSIKVKVEDDDGETSAKLSISLGRINGVEGKAVGSHTWTGLLCDNTPASIAYTVAADGTITLGAITPAGATSSIDEGKTTVTFATGEQVRIKVSDHDGAMTVSVKEKIRCDSADPTFNGSSVPTTVDDNNDNNDNHQGGGGDNHGHGDHAGDDDTTTSSSQP